VDAPTPAIQSFIKKYDAKYHGKPDGLAALGYDAAKILYMAMGDVAKDPAVLAALGDRSSTPATEDSRKAARKALRDRLATVKDFHGVTGIITIDEKRNAQKPAVVVEVTKDGPKYVTAVAPDGTMSNAPAAPADGAAPAAGAAPAEGAAPAAPAAPPAPGAAPAAPAAK